MPISLGKEDDRTAFAEIKRKFESSKKHRQTLRKVADEVKLEKPKYAESGSSAYPARTRLSQLDEDFIESILDN